MDSDYMKDVLKEMNRDICEIKGYLDCGALAPSEVRAVLDLINKFREERNERLANLGFRKV